jgi:hypothetical protein
MGNRMMDIEEIDLALRIWFKSKNVGYHRMPLLQY